MQTSVKISKVGRKYGIRDNGTLVVELKMKFRKDGVGITVLQNGDKVVQSVIANYKKYFGAADKIAELVGFANSSVVA